MVVRDTEDSSWRSLGGDSSGVNASTTMEEELLDIDDSLAAPGQKRSRAQSFHSEEPERKKQHISPEPSAPCLAPAPNPIAQAIFQGSQLPSDSNAYLGAGDVFLTEGWRERWCRCSRVSFVYASLVTYSCSHASSSVFHHSAITHIYLKKKRPMSLQKILILVHTLILCIRAAC